MRTKYLLRLITAAFSFSILPLEFSLAARVEPTQPSTIAQATQENLTTCASNSNKRQRCSMNTRNGVVLVEQLSQTSCEGKWNYGEGYVEVRNGCRARFAQGEQRQGNNTTTCESNSNNSQRCSMNTRNGVVLVEQLSQTSCEGKWNYGEGYVEVRNGCRARFAQGNQGNSNSSNSGWLKARAAYNTILIDRNANFVIGVSQGQLIYVKCGDITPIEGDKRVFAMDAAGNSGYILTNAVAGASCNW